MTIVAMFAFLTFRETKRQADLAQSDQRPWVDAPTITSASCVDKNGIKQDGVTTPGFTFRFNNAGRGSARHIFAVAGFDGQAVAIGKIGDYCRYAIAEHDEAGVSDNGIISGGFYKGHLLKTIDGALTDYSIIGAEDVSKVGANPVLFRCIAYDFPIEHKSHQTGFLAPLIVSGNGKSFCVDASYPQKPD